MSNKVNQRKSGAELRALKAAILAFVQCNKCPMGIDVARAVGCRTKNISEMMAKMRDAGYLDSQRGIYGYTWRITEAGTAFLATGCVKPKAEKIEQDLKAPVVRVLDAVEDSARWWRNAPPALGLRWAAPAAVARHSGVAV